MCLCCFRWYILGSFILLNVFWTCLTLYLWKSQLWRQGAVVKSLIYQRRILTCTCLETNLFIELWMGRMMASFVLWQQCVRNWSLMGISSLLLFYRALLSVPGSNNYLSKRLNRTNASQHRSWNHSSLVRGQLLYPCSLPFHDATLTSNGFVINASPRSCFSSACFILI